MTKQQALERLNLIRVWYEDYGTPDADYDAIVYAIGVIEEAPKGLDTLIKALEAEHKKLIELQSKVGTNLAEEYARAVRNWLVNYQVKCADLAGRYTPYEVLGWIVSDWRKDNGI